MRNWRRGSRIRPTRVTLIAVTRTGRRVAGSLQEIRRRHLHRALPGWTGAELAEFDRLLTRFFDDSVDTPIDD